MIVELNKDNLLQIVNLCNDFTKEMLFRTHTRFVKLIKPNPSILTIKHAIRNKCYDYIKTLNDQGYKICLKKHFRPIISSNNKHLITQVLSTLDNNDIFNCKNNHKVVKTCTTEVFMYLLDKLQSYTEKLIALLLIYKRVDILSTLSLFHIETSYSIMSRRSSLLEFLTIDVYKLFYKHGLTITRGMYLHILNTYDISNIQIVMENIHSGAEFLLEKATFADATVERFVHDNYPNYRKARYGCHISEKLTLCLLYLNVSEGNFDNVKKYNYMFSSSTHSHRILYYAIIYKQYDILNSFPFKRYNNLEDNIILTTIQNPDCIVDFHNIYICEDVWLKKYSQNIISNNNIKFIEWFANKYECRLDNIKRFYKENKLEMMYTLLKCLSNEQFCEKSIKWVGKSNNIALISKCLSLNISIFKCTMYVVLKYSNEETIKEVVGHHELFIIKRNPKLVNALFNRTLLLTNYFIKRGVRFQRKHIHIAHKKGMPVLIWFVIYHYGNFERAISHTKNYSTNMALKDLYIHMVTKNPSLHPVTFVKDIRPNFQNLIKYITHHTIPKSTLIKLIKYITQFHTISKKLIYKPLQSSLIV